ncbi:hypothetical protein SLEP1_g9299 [Rubroshorea leprosula]|uniref:Uncharacterized protein n=1 Tax=Rubroshorea leprosula TaxID=152421 RepID=A0AAV5I4H7_9ROSI|nr:hypothetical protein SLEP1_g9299 [Rubroshorea leprosula]
MRSSSSGLRWKRLKNVCFLYKPRLNNLRKEHKKCWAQQMLLRSSEAAFQVIKHETESFMTHSWQLVQ